VLAEILPDVVACSQAFGDPAGVVVLPEEQAAIAGAVEKRRREYGTVRHCARTALRELGVAPAPILSGAHREPLWPPGVVGSLTHCTNYRAAAVGRARDVHTIGIDAEPHQPLTAGVLGLIALDGERAHLEELAATDGRTRWDRLLFCAKESVYKAWFPLTLGWLGFEQAAVTIDPVELTFSARLLVPGPLVDGERLTGFDGRWVVRHGLVVTAVAVPASP
jgi:4'-phosphopantetheinyl transferase EntD